MEKKVSGKNKGSLILFVLFCSMKRREISIIRKVDLILTGNFVLKCNYRTRLAA